VSEEPDAREPVAGDHNLYARYVAGAHAFEVGKVAERLGPGGYEVVRDSPSLEVGVYRLAAPEPDDQEPHEWDEIYVVLAGRGVITVEGEEIPVGEGGAVFVPARVEHRFSGYETLDLLVLFDKTTGSDD
jgi:mannose-6-phosphate isomerase-like protein (cupin superfamily)